jgi:TPR repeat protein
VKKKIIALCVVAFFLYLNVSPAFAGASDIKKNIDRQNGEKPNAAQPASVAVASDSSAEFIKDVLKKAEQGNANAQYFLGAMYDKGEGVAQDKKKAFEWYTKAVEQGNKKAQENLDKLCQESSSVCR